MKKVPELSLAQVIKILRSDFINRSYIAGLMYPDVKMNSAAAKLTNKLVERNRFKLTSEEQNRLVSIVSKECFKLVN